MEENPRRFSLQSIKRKHILLAVVIVLCIDIAYIGFSLYQSQAQTKPAQLNDQEKLRKVFALYHEYKKNSFAEIDDILPHNIFNFFPPEKVVFVDVRTKTEQDVSMIPHAITQDEFENDMEPYKNMVIITYCTIGDRSGKYALTLKGEELRVYNLIGGILSWVHSGREVHNKGKDVKRVHVFDSSWNLLPAHYQAVQ